MLDFKSNMKSLYQAYLAIGLLILQRYVVVLQYMKFIYQLYQLQIFHITFKIKHSIALVLMNHVFYMIFICMNFTVSKS